MRLFALQHKHILHKTNPANHSHLEPKLHASRRQRQFQTKFTATDNRQIESLREQL
jgi:hypothetical protein